ncbi:Rib/alpha-like domain-containing protein [Staphylococcus simulans]|uniref:Rib/alpha-like domain-containing protein n=1 Tax=Staphylococcus simulans TaxID=1286 RepID=UPI00399B754E
MKDEHTSKRKASFLPDRKNKYSIRKFTVGTASILVGASLLFGLDTQDAQAAEQSTTSTENAATPNKDTKVEVNHADAVVNETANSTSSEVVKTDDVKETLKAIVEAPQPTESKASTEKTTSDDQVVVKETSQKAEVVTSNQQESKQQVVSAEKATLENKAEVQQAVEAPKVEVPTSTLEIQQVQDLNTAAEFYAQSSGVSIEDAQALIQELNLDSNATPEEIQQALIYQLSHEYDVWFKPAVREGLTTEAEHVAGSPDIVKYAATLPNDPEVIEADAIKNGYVRSGSDEINKANLISGRAWITSTGTLATGSNGMLPVPVNTPVFLQWKDQDGSVSPIYVAYTHNNKSDDAAQDGPGAYAFDLRKGWTDATGKQHLYTAHEGQEYRFWIEDFKTPEGNTATMLRQAGGYFPGAFVNTFTGSNLGQVPVVGKNVSRTGIYMSVIPSAHYMTKDANQWSTSNASPGDPGILAVDGMNSVRGKVWLESSGGDKANSATGPVFNPNFGDKVASNYHVVFSTLTAAGASAYRQQVESLPTNQRPAAAKRLLSQHPEYIASTVQTTTDSRGAYAIKFPTGMQMDYLYGFVTDPKGNLVQAYSAYTSPEFRRPNSAPSISPQAIPYPGLQQWANVNFAVVTSPSQAPKLDITNFNTTTQPASPGSKALIKLDGKTIPALPTHIVWTNGAGQVVHTTKDFYTIKEGEKLGAFTIPSGAKDGEIYTALLVSGDNVISGDSLIVRKIQPQKDKYEPTTGEITKPFGTPTTEQEVKDKVTVPKFPTTGPQPTFTVDTTKIPDGQTTGEFQVPVTVTYPDGTKDHVNVKVTVGPKDSDTYEPTTGEITKPFGTPTTEQEVKDKVTVPNFPADKGTPTVTVDDPTKVPDGQTPGVYDVPVRVTYPDKTTDKVTVKVTVGEQPQKDKYEPTTGEITKPFGTPTTEQEVKDKVTIPNFPADKGTPTVTVDDPTKVPDGQTPGVYDVPVTVTYPDKTTDKVNVKVTVGEQPQKDKYEPTTGEITKPFGTPTTPDEVKGKVTVPDFPKTGDQPVITVDDPTKVPDGQTPGVFDVPVTVTYPDKTTDKVTVKVTVGDQADNAKYEPTTGEITKPFGTPTTEQEVKEKVTVPNFPTTGDQPVFTVDTTKIPDGQTTGEFQVPVTVTYPDKTTDTVNVKVTVGPKDSETYEPTTGEITKPFGTPTTPDEVKGKVTVPNFPTTGDQPVITVDDPTKVPDGQTTGVFDVPVTVTYPDKTTDKVTVKVTVGEQADNAKYEPTTGEITKPFGTPTTEQEVKDKVTVPNFPADKGTPVVTVDDPTKVPDGQTPGVFDVPVTVTYPDKTTDKVTVKVTVGDQADNAKYEPTTGEITKPFGTPTTEQEVKDKVTVPNFPATGDQPTITVDDPTKVPDGQTPGVFDVPVTVTYPDKTTDKVTVKVTVGEQPQKDKYEPTTGEITKPFGTPTTEQEVKDKVTVPNFPADKGTPVVTVDDPTKVPDGQTTGVFDVPVTVTYPDKTTDKVTVKVTVGDQADNAKYEPTTGEITKPFGTPTTEDEVKGKVKVPNFPTTGDQPVLTVDTTKVPNGQTSGEFEVPVTVTYPDKTTDTVNVKVTVGPKDSDTYEPTFENITKPFGTPTTEQEVKDKVKVPNFPADKGTPVVTVDDPTKVPDGQTTGVFDVPVTVTYPDGSTDKVTVKVTVGEQPDNAKYDPKAGEITKHYGETTTPNEVKDKVTVPGYPENGQPYTVTVDETKIPDGQTSGEFEVPVTVTYPDKTTDTVNVKVTVGPKDSDTYEPTTEPITKPFGTPTTEQEVKDKVKVPNFPADKGTPVVTVDDPTKVPDGQTPGEYDVPVTVTYPDGTKDHVNVKVTVGPKDSDTYEPTTEPITKPYGQGTTEQEVKDKVKVPNFPADKGTPVVTVDDPTKVPDGQTPGEYDVPVTVTYPDGTKDHVNVKVTVNPQPQNDKYEPTTGEITKPYGSTTTEDEVKDKVSIPDFPKEGDQPVITVDTTKIPDGQTSGEFEVPVTVTYPDKTTDKVTVKVTVGPKDSDTYEPTTEPITKPYGQGTTEQEVKDKVKVSNFPTDKGTPVVTVDDPTKVPDGQTPGEYDVPVTVTYPDGTKDHVNVKVTVNPQPQNDKYEPTTGEITKPYGSKTTEDEVKGKVSIPDFPKEGDQPVITVDTTKIPDGQTSGEFEVPVTVTYPDKTTDKVTVKVTVGPKDSDTYEPTTEPITKPYGQGTTEQEVKDKVKVPNFPADKGTPVVTVDDPTKVPDGQTPGEYDVPVTVTYPDGTKDHVTVKVTVNPQPQNDKYEPTTGEIAKPYGSTTTEDEVKGKVTVPDFPKEGDQPKVTVDDPTKVPDGQTPGEYDVPVTVTYPDGTKDHVNVKVTVGPKDSDTYEPTTEPITKPYGQGTTEQEVKDKVKVPNFPADKGTPVVTVDDPTKVPDGQTTGVFDVPVTVTYPDGTKDHVNVKVTVNPQPQNDKYEPTTGEITKPYGSKTTEDEVKGKVSIPDFPKEGDQPVITVDTTKIPDGQTSGEFEVPVTVTYPDKTTDKVTVKVTVGPKDSDTYEPTTEPITKPYGQGTTEQEVKDKVKVPNFPVDKGTPVVTVDDPTKVPDGQTPGEYDVPVTVTYPDGTKDHVNVKVTVGPKDSDTYEPTTEPITKPYGQGTTEQEVKDKVKVPNFPTDKGTPVVTVDDPTKVPDGQTPGVFDVPVTVTYPDGTKDHVTVKVTVGPKDSDVFEPVTETVEKPYGTPTTIDDVVSKVTVPGYSKVDDPYKVTVDDPSELPNGQTPGEYDVTVTVTYPDGSTDHVVVKVVVGPKDSDTYEPTTEPIEKPFGTPTTIDEVVGKVTVPGYPENEKPYTVTVDDPSLIPSGSIPGTYDVPVTVTYPDGTKDHVNVTITVDPQPDADIYNPGYNDVEVNPGESIEIPQVKDEVPTGTRFEIPEESGVDKDWTVTVDPDTGKVTVTAPKDAVEGDVVTVTVQVTYPDGSTENVTVNVTVHDSIAPEAPVVNPIEAGDRIVTGTGKEPGTTVTVTFPDGSTVSTKVDKDGNWKADVPSTVTLKVGDTVKAVITDEAGNVSEETAAPVKDTVAPDAPVVNGIHTGDKVITGTAEPGTTVTVTFPNGTTVSVKVGQDGTWSVDVPSGVTLRTGDKVTAVAIDDAGNVSKSTTAIVVGDKEGTPSPNEGKTKVSTDRTTNHTHNNNQSTKVEVSKAKDTDSNKAAKKAKSTAKALPNTGEETTNSGVLFGGLFAALGSILLFRKRRNHDDNK